MKKVLHTFEVGGGGAQKVLYSKIPYMVSVFFLFFWIQMGGGVKLFGPIFWLDMALGNASCSDERSGSWCWTAFFWSFFYNCLVTNPLQVLEANCLRSFLFGMNICMKLMKKNWENLKLYFLYNFIYIIHKYTGSSRLYTCVSFNEQ